MTIASLGYLGFEVKDIEAWDAFATGVLGLMPAGPAASGRRYRADDLAWRIAAAAGTADDLAYAGFEVAGPAELEAVAEVLAQAGVPVEWGDSGLLAERGVLGLVACRDPDGLLVEIHYGPTLRTDQPFASAAVSGFVTGEQGLGHIVISASNVAATRRFYRDLLGFRLSDIIRMRISPDRFLDLEFYHCNPRHHTLALVPLAAKRRLFHFMLQAPSLDEVGFALERAGTAGTPITQTLGRHSNDQMVSFYAQTPAGFEVEFGYGAITIDEATWRVSRHDRTSRWGHHRPARG
jgi:biphenyl-2,3-diol 1,2-dioxygenase